VSDVDFQADAHISREIVEMIRSLGHDCADASSIPIAMPDVDVLRTASAAGRVIVTADKDFGELVFVHAIGSPGVILLRLTMATERERVAHLQSLWPTLVSRLPGAFITVARSGVRSRPIP
jgi:predicted nuclease of predicted toxin-antitoxin system